MRGRDLWRRCCLLVGGLVWRIGVFAQDGNTGISQANTMVRGYYTTATNLMYAIGGVVGLIGAIRVYSLWVQGEPHTTRVAVAWFSACIFLVVVATVIQSFFGL